MTGRTRVGSGDRFESVPLLLILGCRGLASTVESAFPAGGVEALDDSHHGAFELILLGLLALDERLTDLVGSPDRAGAPDGLDRRPPAEDLLR